MRELAKSKPGVGDEELEKLALTSLLSKFADQQGYVLKDPKNLLIRGLIKRKEKFGEYYCPCRVVVGDKEKDEWKICPSTEVSKDIEDSGRFHCGLFWKSTANY